MINESDFQVLGRFERHLSTEEFVVLKAEVPVLRMFCRGSIVFEDSVPTFKVWDEDGVAMRCPIRVV